MSPNDREVLLETLKRTLAGRLSKTSREPDPETQEEEEDLDRQRTKALIRGIEQDINERKKYATGFFVLACFWLAAITIMLTLQGFGSFWFGRMPFKLSETVLLAVIGSTTVNVLGILYVVANYLFPKRGDKG
jgi:hypothetical protein